MSIVIEMTTIVVAIVDGPSTARYRFARLAKIIVRQIFIIAHVICPRPTYLLILEAYIYIRSYVRVCMHVYGLRARSRANRVLRAAAFQFKRRHENLISPIYPVYQITHSITVTRAKWQLGSISKYRLCSLYWYIINLSPARGAGEMRKWLECRISRGCVVRSYAKFINADREREGGEG